MAELCTPSEFRALQLLSRIINEQGYYRTCKWLQKHMYVIHQSVDPELKCTVPATSEWFLHVIILELAFGLNVCEEHPRCPEMLPEGHCSALVNWKAILGAYTAEDHSITPSMLFQAALFPCRDTLPVEYPKCHQVTQGLGATYISIDLLKASERQTPPQLYFDTVLDLLSKPDISGIKDEAMAIVNDAMAPTSNGKGLGNLGASFAQSSPANAQKEPEALQGTHAHNIQDPASRTIPPHLRRPPGPVGGGRQEMAARWNSFAATGCGGPDATPGVGAADTHDRASERASLAGSAAGPISAVSDNHAPNPTFITRDPTGPSSVHPYGYGGLYTHSNMYSFGNPYPFGGSPIHNTPDSPGAPPLSAKETASTMGKENSSEMKDKQNDSLQGHLVVAVGLLRQVNKYEKSLLALEEGGKANTDSIRKLKEAVDSMKRGAETVVLELANMD